MMSTNTLPVCNSLEQLMKHEKLYQKLGSMEESMLVETTGCDLPCVFMEYRQEGIPYEYSDKFGLGVVFGTTDVLVQEEVLVYPLLSFIAEFGGALGLFLGLSFNMLWDALGCVIEAAQQKKNVVCFKT